MAFFSSVTSRSQGLKTPLADEGTLEKCTRENGTLEKATTEARSSVLSASTAATTSSLDFSVNPFAQEEQPKVECSYMRIHGFAALPLFGEVARLSPLLWSGRVSPRSMVDTLETDLNDGQCGKIRLWVKVADAPSEKVFNTTTEAIDHLKAERNKASPQALPPTRTILADSVAITGSRTQGGAVRRDDADFGGVRQQAEIQEDNVTQAEVAIHGEIVSAYAEDVVRVAKDVRMLRDTFRSMQVLVAEQSEDLDNIEAGMAQTVQNMQGVGEQLGISNQNQQKHNKKIYCMLVVALLMAIIVISVVLNRNN